MNNHEIMHKIGKNQLPKTRKIVHKQGQINEYIALMSYHVLKKHFRDIQ